MRQWRVVILESGSSSCGEQVQTILEGERHYQVERHTDSHTEVTAGKHHPPALCIPILPASSAQIVPYVATLRAAMPQVPILPVLHTLTPLTVLDRLESWVTDFLVSPLLEVEVLARTSRRLARCRAPVPHGNTVPGPDGVGLAQLVGSSPTFMAVKQQLPRLAQVDAPFLLTGETGTGKEICMRALHYLSPRAAKPFLPVNCGALPMELFERELFGHRKGAFTGATSDQPGLITEADGGTLFLDEIETLSPHGQAALLRFLQDQTYYALGSPKPLKANVRILAATNVDLSRKAQEGTFRADLFYRLAVLTLVLPPLREWREDIPQLVAALGAQYTAQYGLAERTCAPSTLAALSHYDWPGNVRELANVVQQVLLMSDGATIALEDLPNHLQSPVPAAGPISMQKAKAHVIAQFERHYLTELLHLHRGNVTQAARAAQKERHAFRRLLQKHHINPIDVS